MRLQHVKNYSTKKEVIFYFKYELHEIFNFIQWFSLLHTFKLSDMYFIIFQSLNIS